MWISALTGLLLLSYSTGTSGQIIDNRKGNAFKEEMYFSQEFLWQNRIKSMTGVVSIKRPNRPIEQRPDVIVYRFNEVGLLQQLDKVTSVLNLVDSMRIEYKRNDLGEVELRNEQSRSGFYSTRFIYDHEGRLSRLDYGKSENTSEERGKLEPGRQVLINSETYEYDQASERTTRLTKFNNYGLLYAYETITRNELGYIISDSEELVMSGKTITRNYTYNEHGWLSTITVTDNQGGTPRREEFFYDELGNLLKVNYYSGKTLTEEVEVLYTETMLIEAILRHDLQSHDIVITKFSYEFYP